ncbi:MAG: hypothetical protein JSV36_00970 [Anaerolineae bacterium]|nr:MAG: hypothetical protein JSV36_00970 [Anaerolineae bacterium]
MTDESPRYLAFMVRLWRTDTQEGPVWRASAESPHTGERQGFASLEALCAFLVEEARGAQTGTKPESPEEGGRG